MTERLVVLDGCTLTPNGVGQTVDAEEPTWDALAALGDLHVHDRTAAADILPRARDASIVLTNKTVLNDRALAALPALRYIGVLATGTNVIDLPAARERQITVTNVPGYSSASVAQHVFALLLELVSHVAAHDRAVRAGQWTKCPDFSFTVAPLTELAGKTLGIVGVGDIGKRVAQIGHALGMRIAAAHQSSMARVKLPGIDIAWMDVDELFAHADVITLHCPLTDLTRCLVNADRLGRMKRHAILINTGRGPLIDEAALAAALRDGTIAGAGLDVLGNEPPAADNPLLNVERCIITPHIAWASREARHRLMTAAVGNIKAFLAGTPTNVVG